MTFLLILSNRKSAVFTAKWRKQIKIVMLILFHFLRDYETISDKLHFKIYFTKITQLHQRLLKTVYITL